MAKGRSQLERTICEAKPGAVVFVGVVGYRAFFGKKGAVRCGEQPERIEGARVFVVPNPSGRNAHFSYAQMLEAFTGVARSLGRSRA
jgi:TDG/mug DNA glycosylase family protein